MASVVSVCGRCGDWIAPFLWWWRHVEGWPTHDHWGWPENVGIEQEEAS